VNNTNCSLIYNASSEMKKSQTEGLERIWNQDCSILNSLCITVKHWLTI